MIEKADLDARHRFPFWLPISKQYPQGFLIVDASKAVNAGLSIRSLGETAHDTRQWANHLNQKNAMRAQRKKSRKH